jgi:hypothetical protein
VFGADIRYLRKRSAGALGSCQPTRGVQDRQGEVVGARARWGGSGRVSVGYTANEKGAAHTAVPVD